MDRECHGYETELSSAYPIHGKTHMDTSLLKTLTENDHSKQKQQSTKFERFPTNIRVCLSVCLSVCLHVCVCVHLFTFCSFFVYIYLFVGVYASVFAMYNYLST